MWVDGWVGRWVGALAGFVLIFCFSSIQTYDGINKSRSFVCLLVKVSLSGVHEDNYLHGRQMTARSFVCLMCMRRSRDFVLAYLKVFLYLLKMSTR